MLAIWAVLLLLLELPAPTWAEDAEVMSAKDAEDAPETHSDEEWEQLKKNIMDSLPDDDDEHHEEDDDPDEDARWHITGGYPFIEYDGFLDEDHSREHKNTDGVLNTNLHVGTMTLEEAKDWCAKEEACRGFNHAGEAGDGPFEFYFKDYWKLNVDTGEAWTAYMKGEKIVDEALIDESEEDDVAITSEDVLKEYGMDVDEQEKGEL